MEQGFSINENGKLFSIKYNKKSFWGNFNDLFRVIGI